MESISQASFEQIWEYLQKVISPDIDVMYPNPVTDIYNRDPVPYVSAPDHRTVVGYYKKHFPNRNAPTMAAIDEGYEWIWKEFKLKVRAKILNLDNADRAFFIDELASFFDSLQIDYKAYCAQLAPLEKYGLEMFLRMYTPVEQPLQSYEGIFAQQQAAALKNAIWVIEEGTAFVNGLKNHLDETKLPEVNKANQKDGKTTQACLALFYFYCHEKNCLPPFQAGKMILEYQDTVKPYGLSWKSFQQHYNRFKKKNERMAEANRAALLDAIKMLNPYPEALEMAEDELRTSKTRKPIT